MSRAMPDTKERQNGSRRVKKAGALTNSKRTKEVTYLCALGLTVAQIAKHLSVHPSLVSMSMPPELRRAYHSRPTNKDVQVAQREAWEGEWSFTQLEDCHHWNKSKEYGRWRQGVRHARRREAKTPYYISLRIRNRIKAVLKGQRRDGKFLDLLGCSAEEAKQYIASKLKRGMTWGNYGTAWHIDHIIPCAAFDLRDPKQQRQCFHFSNLQPMKVSENLRKSDTITDPQMRLCV